MSHKELNWKSKDGLDIYGRVWTPENGEKIEQVICLVHGFGEHSGRYHHVAKMFNNRGWAVLACDHRGHGKSEGQRGHTPYYEHLLDDMENLLLQAEQLFPTSTKILYGHSMGGNIMTNYVIQRNPKIKGTIVTGPFYRTASPPPKFLWLLARIMNKIWPSFPNKVPLEANHISRDKAIVEAYVNDPMVHNKMSARMGYELIKKGEQAIEQANMVKSPLLILHGEDDQLTDFNGSKSFVTKANDNVTFIPYKGLFHELHNEPEKETVFKDIINWCDQLS